MVRSLLLAGAVVLAAGTAQAAPDRLLTQADNADKLAANIFRAEGTFGTYFFNDATRKQLERAFDASSDTFYSPGVGGVLRVTVNPPSGVVRSGAVIEVTFGNNGSHQEAAEVFLAKYDPVTNVYSGLQSVGFLLNEEAADQVFSRNTNTADVIDLANDDVVLAATNVALGQNTAGGRFTISYTGNTAFNTLIFQDRSRTMINGRQLAVSGGSASQDGFDFTNVAFTEVGRLEDLSEPGTLAILGSGLLALGLIRRRRKA